MRAQDYADLYALEESLWWFTGMREVTRALLDPFCPPGPRRDVLDAGCGTGGMLTWLGRYAGRGRGLRDVAQASVTALPFDPQTFDLVTSFDVLVQLPGEGSDEEAMREMRRVLRPGGFAFVRVAAYEWMRSGHDEALDTRRRYTLARLTERMTRAGFRVRRATYANSLLLPAAVLRRLVLKRLGLADRGSDVRPPGSERLNRALASALKAEAALLKRPNVNLPAGLSAICVAERPR